MTAALPFLLPAMVLAAAGNLLLSRGMRALGGGERPASIATTLWHALRSFPVWAGMVSYVTAMGFWLQVLGRTEIGLVYPVFLGGATVLVMAASRVVLGERLERRRLIGAVLMVAGILLASME